MHKARHRSVAEPFKIKMVEPLKITTRDFREKMLLEARFNTALLKPDAVFIDLLSDIGTSAAFDVDCCGCNLEDSLRKFYGCSFVITTSLQRDIEYVVSHVVGSSDRIVPINLSCAIDEANDPTSFHPFKGNVDLQKLATLFSKSKNLSYVTITAATDREGGQPISMQNLGEIRDFCSRSGKKVVLDVSRGIENAYFIQQREAGHRKKTVGEILREMCSFADVIASAGNRDLMFNTGAFVAVKDEALYEELRHHQISVLKAGDIEAMACAIEDAVRDESIRARVEQVEYVGMELLEHEIPIVQPVGGHGIFLDAKRFLPHLSDGYYPANSLSAELYLQAGVRSLAVHESDYVGLLFPPRVYTQGQYDFVIEAIEELYHDRSKINGLKMTSGKFTRA